MVVAVGDGSSRRCSDGDDSDDDNGSGVSAGHHSPELENGTDLHFI